MTTVGGASAPTLHIAAHSGIAGLGPWRRCPRHAEARKVQLDAPPCAAGIPRARMPACRRSRGKPDPTGSNKASSSSLQGRVRELSGCTGGDGAAWMRGYRAAVPVSAQTVRSRFVRETSGMELRGCVGACRAAARVSASANTWTLGWRCAGCRERLDAIPLPGQRCWASTSGAEGRESIHRGHGAWARRRPALSRGQPDATPAISPRRDPSAACRCITTASPGRQSNPLKERSA
jgi:hypothetical protein